MNESPLSPRDVDTEQALTQSADAPLSRRERRSARWRTLGHLAGFQFKLILDGLKDVLLGPLSLVAVAFGLLSGRDHPGRLLYRVMRWGRRYEDWIDLYGAAARDVDVPRLVDGRSTSDNATSDPHSGNNLDVYLGRIERAIAAQGGSGLTGKAREALDRALDAIEQSKPRE